MVNVTKRILVATIALSTCSVGLSQSSTLPPELEAKLNDLYMLYATQTAIGNTCGIRHRLPDLIDRQADLLIKLGDDWRTLGKHMLTEYNARTAYAVKWKEMLVRECQDGVKFKAFSEEITRVQIALMESNADLEDRIKRSDRMAGLGIDILGGLIKNLLFRK